MSTTCIWTPLTIQEPPYAIVLLNQPVQLRSFVKVWNSAEFRVSVDGGTNRLYELQNDESKGHIVDPDLITGDFDSVHENVLKSYKTKGIEVVQTPDQDHTDFTKALLEIQSRVAAKKIPKVDRILAIIEATGRLDHIFANLKTLMTPELNIPVFILAEKSTTWLLSSGKHSIQVDSKYLQGKNNCGIIPLCGPTHIVSNGLKWNLNDVYRFDGGGIVSTSNVIVSEIVDISTEKEVIWTMKTPIFCD